MTAYAQRMTTKIESSGALQIAVGAVMIVFGVGAASNGAAVFAAMLIVGGALFVAFGIIRNVKQRPTETTTRHTPTP